MNQLMTSIIIPATYFRYSFCVHFSNNTHIHSSIKGLRTIDTPFRSNKYKLKNVIRF